MHKGENQSLRVFMLPWLAHGHLSPFLELAKSLSKRNIFIYLCSTPINLQFITGKLENYSTTIDLVELHLPSLPELSLHLHTTKGLPPHLLPTLAYAFRSSQPNLSDILEKLKPDIVIHDGLHPWVGELASSMDIPAISFQTSSATSSSFFMNMLMNPGGEYPFPGIYLHDFEKSELVARTIYARDDIQEMHLQIGSPKTSCNISLIKSFRELEGEAIDYYSVVIKKKVLPIGLLVEDPMNKSNNGKSSIIKWLDNKGKHSCVYVSFGSEYILSKEEMEEIGYGLEMSEVNFIWVVRFPKEEGIEEIRVLEEKLPKGFLERVGKRGLILDGWAPQMEILSHESVGGFMSHCGWGSVIESIKCGVPIIALPMQLDQPLNARQMIKAGVSVEVTRDETGKFHREEVAKVIRKVVVDENGEEIRKKTREMSEERMLRGDKEIDVLADELLRICGEKTSGDKTQID